MTSRQVRLDELLPDEMINEIMRAGKRGTLTIAWLKDFLGQHREMLEAKGVLPEYLAYVIAHQLGISR